MNKVSDTLEQAELHCQARGVRLTAKRKNVLTGLIQSNKALSAYELISFYQEEYGETMAAMSIYRILDFLEQENLVHKLKLANKYVACAHMTCEHSHAMTQFLICQMCNVVKEISIDDTMIQRLHQSVQDANFTLTSPQLEINGLCHHCATNAM
jgi:Fur family transcriptional regulator, zinc uptake regulator